MSRNVRRHLGLLAAALLLLASAACSGSDSDVDAGGPSDGPGAAGDGDWVSHTLGPFAADRDIVGAPIGDGIAVLTVEEPGEVHGYFLAPDGTVREASVEAGRAAFRMVTAITDGPNGLVAIGNDSSPDFENFVLTSPDGLRWTEPATSGLDTPMDVVDLAATDDGYVAVGTLRTAEDPAQGGFVPAIVTSPDGTNWSNAQTPSSEEGTIRSVVTVGPTMHAAGDVGGAPVVWRSPDGGQRWTPVEGAPPASEIVASGGTLLGAHSRGEDGDGLTLHRSVDGGETWHEVDAGFADGFGFASFSGDQEGFAMQTAEAYRDAFSSPELCYADIELCGPRSSVEDEALLISSDGVDWTHLALDALDGLFRPRSVLHNDSGDTVVLGTTGDGEWGAWIWAASQGEVPTATPTNDVPVYDGPPIVEYGADLEEGMRYAFPLYIHCGMDHLGEFDGVQWELADARTGERPETGAGDPIPEDWPVVGQSILGYLTLVSNDRIEYSLEGGEVIGIYGPMPADEEVPGCA